MQRAKRVILVCLQKNGASDRFALRKLISDRMSTNASELIRNLNVLEDIGCIRNNHGSYTITEKGTELLELLEKVTKILK